MTEAGGQPAENLIRFDERLVDLQWVNSHWQLAVGGAVLKDFGRFEAEAREALRLIHDLGLNQMGTVGTPRPVMEYWLADGHAPQNPGRGLRTVPLDLNTLRTEQIQGQWCLRDNLRLLFSFGGRADEANQALAVIRRYGFTQIGYIGQPQPVMLIFLTNASGQPDARPVGMGYPSNGVQPVAYNEPNRAGPPNAGAARPMPANSGVQDERIPFDWRQVQLRHENQEWKLATASYTLANFGASEYEARQALQALQHYRFTEHHLVGQPRVFSYFLVNGQAPRGLMLGMTNTSFQPDALSVRHADNGCWICEENRPLIYFGDQLAEARHVLEVIKKYGFDHLCRIGHSEPAVMTFLVRMH
jgi:hypothetical protein